MSESSAAGAGAAAERSVSEPSVSAPDPGRQTKTSSAFFPASSRSVSPKDSRVFLPALPV